ncbi:MAG: type II toxin-antitoxin system PemK/MazF family toxin [Spirochaetota bacterium]
MTTCKPGDLVNVPFPFIDVPEKKLRPALVLSDQQFHQTSGAIILMMVTSAGRSRWDSDIVMDDWQAAGLHKASILRFKIFTIDEQLVVSRRGALSDRDQQKVRNFLRNIFSYWA